MHLDVSPGRAATGMGLGDLLGWIDDQLSRADEHDSSDSAAQGWNVWLLHSATSTAFQTSSSPWPYDRGRIPWCAGILTALAAIGQAAVPTSFVVLASIRLAKAMPCWTAFRVLSFVTIFATRAPQIFKRPGRARAFCVFQ
jgi:hypothetical protein